MRNTLLLLALLPLVAFARPPWERNPEPPPESPYSLPAPASPLSGPPTGDEWVWIDRSLVILQEMADEGEVPKYYEPDQYYISRHPGEGHDIPGFSGRSNFQQGENWYCYRAEWPDCAWPVSNCLIYWGCVGGWFIEGKGRKNPDIVFVTALTPAVVDSLNMHIQTLVDAGDVPADHTFYIRDRCDYGYGWLSEYARHETLHGVLGSAHDTDFWATLAEWRNRFNGRWAADLAAAESLRCN